MNTALPFWVNRMNTLGSNRSPFFFLISFDKKEAIILADNEMLSDVQYNINGHSNESKCPCPSQPLTTLLPHPISKDKYAMAFDKVMARINYGDSYLVNLTIATPIDTSMNLCDIYQFADAPYKLLVKDRFVVFSPESFIKIQNGKIFSFPMKGTIDADSPEAEMTLMNDEKEKAEHYTIVDLIRNDLSMVAQNVEVKRFRYIDHLYTNGRHLLQTSSEICGLLTDDHHASLGDIFWKLLPAGSISGAPKNATLDIIHEAEYSERGFYTGVFGYYNGQSLDSGVAIRFIEKNDSGMVYRSGGGITSMSHCENEYQELLSKIYVPTGRKHMDQ